MLCSADARYYAVLILYAVILLYAVLCYAVLMLYAVFMLYAMLCYAQKCASEFSVRLELMLLGFSCNVAKMRVPDFRPACNSGVQPVTNPWVEGHRLHAGATGKRRLLSRFPLARACTR